ncbi:Bax inhibitor-1/YccA family protein [Lactobacillus kunkeei]|uniref:Bax inhibitor-1/YccA family protein n=1 Tax=Apilactobacillus nanyangensis TaxID=2799579 RepID=A0ABT0I0E7_9LACO|nr:Bax inhibitor-1/YccA family protein [Apilactobacillus nanyangensis]MBC6388206.1 Bax inhibitor-1/YccA family protein [Apilactobacillus kunkeei]MCK8612039.1 Bax inhibitor-1/YccA family protein [Apilactobacillus nanyangensis]TMT02747.1 Bax inhibitor-1/YccA family protein [Apilactobacillus kunkeei]TMT04279.1 Bax inhibitor-1/YccA family protein [Apilactobacillus kunkeei]CAI2666914.1 Inner membrane protein YbhL [Apilactobacillus kunkeei]
MNNYDQAGRRLVNDAFGMNRFLTKTYGWMTLSVLISGMVAYIVGGNLHIAFSGFPAVIGMILWVVLAFATQSVAMRNAFAGFILLVVFSALTGGIFSYVFMFYSPTAIAEAFFTTTIDFAIMALIGITTKKSLDKIGTQAMAALIALFIVSIINMFLHNPLFDLFISFIAVIIFTAFTAYDSQKIKESFNEYGSEVSENGLAISGAMVLYLDFINLFLNLLSIFGIGDNNR